MNKERFMELISAEQESLRRFLLALCCGDRMLAEDIAQESLIKAYLASDRYVEQYRFATWLYRIAYHTFVDYRRRDKHYAGEIDERTVAGDESSADKGFEYQELYAALNELSSKERTSILLFYMQGYSIKEISHITGNSENAVKMQLSRGRNNLKSKLYNER